jgi:hypothetical protein
MWQRSLALKSRAISRTAHQFLLNMPHIVVLTDLYTGRNGLLGGHAPNPAGRRFYAGTLPRLHNLVRIAIAPGSARQKS